MKKKENAEQKAFQRLELRFKSLISHNKEFLRISRDFIEQTLRDLYYLRSFHKELSSKEESYNDSQCQMQTLQARLHNQDSLLKTIDLTYMEKMNDLKEEISQINMNKFQTENDLNAKILLISQENQTLQLELTHLQANLSEKTKEINEITQLKVSLELRVKELEDLKQYKLSDLKTPFTNPQWIDMDLDKKIQKILRSPISDKIFAFLKPRDVFSLTFLNKSTFQWFSFNGKQYIHALQFLEQSWHLKCKELKFKMGYFQRISDKTPEEFLKSAIVRFICQKERFGEYMTPILHEAQKLVFMQNNEEVQKIKNQKNKAFIKIEKASGQTIGIMNETIGKLFPYMGYFIKGELLQAVDLESKEMIARSLEKANDISGIMLLKFPECSEAFCKSFAKLLVFSALLLQDSKVYKIG